MRVRLKMPTWSAVQWDGHSDPPGVVRDKDSDRAYVRTAHQALYELRPGMWLVYSDAGEHQRPCRDRAELDKTYEQA